MHFGQQHSKLNFENNRMVHNRNILKHKR